MLYLKVLMHILNWNHFVFETKREGAVENGILNLVTQIAWILEHINGMVGKGSFSFLGHKTGKFEEIDQNIKWY